MSSRERELWDVYTQLARIYTHWTINGGRSRQSDLTHQCSDQTCRSVTLGPQVASKTNVYVCDVTGRYHVCGKNFCDSAIGRRTQWTCDITQRVFPPNMCVYQKDLIRQCVVIADEHTPTFMHTAAFQPQAELDHQLHAFRREYGSESNNPTPVTRWTSTMPTRQNIEHFDQLFTTHHIKFTQPSLVLCDKTTANSAGMGAAAAATSTATNDSESKRTSTLRREKMVSTPRKKATTRKASPGSSPASTTADANNNKRRKTTHDEPSTHNVNPADAMDDIASAVAVDTSQASSSHSHGKKSTLKKDSVRHTPFRFPAMHLSEPCEEYAQEALHRIVHAATHRKNTRKKLRAVSIFRQELLQIDSHEHKHLLQLATQCWNSWAFILPILTRTPILADNWLAMYTLDIHCILMLMASHETEVQSFHWLGENNPNHPLLAKVCPNKKQLHELGITHARLQWAMQCMHDISLYK